MAKVTFRCKRSGNFIAFDNEQDIESVRKHEGYEEVIQNGNQETSKEVQVPVQAPHAEKVLKQRGRPRKEEVTEI